MTCCLLPSARTLEWASTGSLGDPPQPDRAQHDKLAAVLARAAQSAAAAKGACAGIAERQVAIVAELRAIDVKISAAVLDEFTIEHGFAIDDAASAVSTAAVRIARANSFRAWLAGMARRLQSAGRHDDAIDLFRRIEKLPSASSSLAVDDASLGQMMQDWARQYEDGMSGDG